MPLPSGQLLIAEAKHDSPFDGSLGRSFEASFEIAEAYGDIISILVDPRWNGSLHDLDYAREQTDKPLLAKAMHSSNKEIELAFKHGADYALAYDFLPTVKPERCLIEPRNLERFALLNSKLMVWNSRDLTDGRKKQETADQAAQALVGQWWCQASFVRDIKQVHPDADAVIVGTHIEEFVRPLSEAPVLPRELWP
jgi:indole-3-glycerol phosphate synthase